MEPIKRRESTITETWLLLKIDGAGAECWEKEGDDYSTNTSSALGANAQYDLPVRKLQPLWTE